MMTFKLIVAVLFLIVLLYEFVVEKDWLFLKGYDGLSDYAHYAHQRLTDFEERVHRNSEKVNKVQGIISFSLKMAWILLTTITLLL